jgi:beta-glucosidase
MSTTQFLPDGGRRTVWSGTEGIEELIRAFYVRYDKPIFWTETSVSGPVEDRLQWLEDSLGLVHRLRSEGLPLVGYTWWPLFSLLDWAYREGRSPRRITCGIWVCTTSSRTVKGVSFGSRRP